MLWIEEFGDEGTTVEKGASFIDLSIPLKDVSCWNESLTMSSGNSS